MMIQPRFAIHTLKPAKNVRCIGLRKSFCNMRIPTYQHIRYSSILFGKCNFRCKFCFENGNFASPAGIIPGSKLILYNHILSFIKDACKTGDWIKITGGEPSLFPDITLQLVDEIHSYGTKVSIDTNGSYPNIVKMFSEKADFIGLDIKGNYDNISYLTGVPREKSYYPVLETIRHSHSYKCIIEIKTILFDTTTFTDLLDIYSLIPKHAYWEWKQYRPHSGTLRVPKQLPLRPMEKDKIYGLARNMVAKYPQLREQLIVVCGSGRTAINYSMFSNKLEDYTLSYENYRCRGTESFVKEAIYV